MDSTIPQVFDHVLKQAGKSRSDLDMIVAAIAEVNECVIVTDNEKHFAGLEVLNP